MAKTKCTKALSERQAQRIFDDVMKCEPLLNKEDMEGIERELSGSGSLAIARRLGLATAIQDGEWFKKLSEDRIMAVVVAGQLEAIESGAAALREVVGVIESAATRTRIALCAYADLEQLMAESKSHAVLEFDHQVTH